MRPHRDDVKKFGAKILENCKLTSWIKKCLKKDYTSVEEIYESIDHVRASPEHYFGCTYDLKPGLKYSKDACIRRGLSDFNQKFKEVHTAFLALKNIGCPYPSKAALYRASSHSCSHQASEQCRP